MELTERSSAALDIEQSVPLTSEIAWTDLPALPRPASRQRTECRMGCGIVLTIVATCLTATHTGVRTLECAPRRWDWLLYVVYAEAAVALLCLAGLVFDDPGTVRRSRLTCEPVPPEARARRCVASTPRAAPRSSTRQPPTTTKAFESGSTTHAPLVRGSRPSGSRDHASAAGSYLRRATGARDRRVAPERGAAVGGDDGDS